jgi:hypothetical protein
MIQEFKKHLAQIMDLNRCPNAFWDFAWEYTRDIRQFLAWKGSNDRSQVEVESVLIRAD